MRKILLYFLCLDCIFFICINSYCQHSPYIISIEKELTNIKPTGLKEIGSTIIYIPLETSKECFLKDLIKIVVTDSYIAVQDLDKILLFDISGHFISEIGKRGRGPGEYQGWISDFCFSLDGNKIYLLSTGGNNYICMEFDVKGFFIRSYQLDSKYIRMIPLKDNLFVFHPNNAHKDRDPILHSLVISDLQNNIQKTYKNHHKLTVENSRIGYVGGSSFYSYKGNMRFREFGADTIFTVTEKGLLPYAIFSLGKKLMPVDIFVPANFLLSDGSVNLDRLLRPHEGKYFLTSAREDVDNIYFRLEDWRKSLLGFFSKRSNTVKIIGVEGFQNDINGGLPFFPKYAYDDILFDYVNAFDMREHALRKNVDEMKKLYGKNWDDLIKLVNSLNDESNPIVVMIRK